MNTEVSRPLSDRIYSISYEPFETSARGRDLQSQGALKVVAEGEAFVFTGIGRRPLSFSRVEEVRFSRRQIQNVGVEGARIEFLATADKPGSHSEPFTFFCRTAEEAAEIGAVLPATKDADAQAGAEFARRLDQLPTPARPWGWVTNGIIAVNIVVFAIMGVLGAGWFEVADMMPYILYGANRTDVTVDGEWWRLVASMFLHYGLMHLLLNMWALLQTGHLVERLFGRRLYAIAYFGSGIAGSVTTLLWHRQNLVWSAGASGAVFGVYGLLIGYMLREKQALPKSVVQPMLKSTLAFAGYNILYGLVHPNIDNAAHLGGLTGGVVLGWVLALPLDREVRAQLVRRRAQMGAGVIVLFVVGGILAAPRFDYHLMDEIALQSVNKIPIPKERELLDGQKPAIAAFSNGGSASELRQWLSGDALPFYRQWRKDLDALQLESNRRTAIQRDALVRVIGMKLEAYEKLLGAIDRGNASAISDFEFEEKRIVEEIKKFPKRTK